MRVHDDIRIPYDFKFYVRHSTSDDVFSLFVMFFCENYSIFITKSVHLHCQINFNMATNDAVPSHCETLCNIFYVSNTKPNPITTYRKR